MNDDIPTNPAPWADIVSIFDKYDRRALRIAFGMLVPAIAAGLATAATYGNDFLFNCSVGVVFAALFGGTVMITFNDKGRRSSMRSLLGKGRWSLPDGAVGSLKDSSRGDVEFSLTTGRVVFSERDIRALAQRR